LIIPHPGPLGPDFPAGGSLSRDEVRGFLDRQARQGLARHGDLQVQIRAEPDTEPDTERDAKWAPVGVG
jgi:hypothetical protein